MATLGNLNWCGERFTMDDVVARPEFSHYTHLDPERGDFGIVAELADATAGVCWAQFLPADKPGYGFASETTPEVSLWVSPKARGRGCGRHLLESLIVAANDSGLEQLSLSVEDGNFARQLYQSLGFVPVADREEAGVMLLHL